MLKAILYYILLIAEFIITIFGCGFAMGIYIALYMDKLDFTNKEEIINKLMPMLIVIIMISMLIIWLTFHKAKFSKFTLGKVIPSQKWKAMLFTSLPVMGITLFYHTLMNLLQIQFVPKEMEEIGYLKLIPFALFGSFIASYIFYGAILEELIKCGKKKWVQLLTLCIMMLPFSIFSVSRENHISCEYLAVLATICIFYSVWIYGKTRSSIILFVVYLSSNLIPIFMEKISLTIALLLLAIGLALTTYGILGLRKYLPEMIEKDED